MIIFENCIKIVKRFGKSLIGICIHLDICIPYSWRKNSQKRKINSVNYTYIYVTQFSYIFYITALQFMLKNTYRKKSKRFRTRI